MTRIDGLVAFAAEVWALSGERALLHDGASFVEVWIAPGDRPRYELAKGAGCTLVVVGRWSLEETPRGAKRLLVASLPREILAQTPRLAHAIATHATQLPADPFALGADPAAPVPSAASALRPWWSIEPDERGIAAILGGAVAIGLTLGIALAMRLM